MLEAQKKTKRNESKIVKIISLLIFIIIATFILIRMDFIRDFLGLDINENNGFNIILKISIISLSVFISLILFVYSGVKLYHMIPIKGEFNEEGIFIQKKILVPHYRITRILSIKGLPRKNEKNISNDENWDNNYWDIIASIAKICDEVSFWIIKKQNRIKLYFSISNWGWFSKNKVKKKTRNGIISVKSAFNNKYPSIRFEDSSIKDSLDFVDVIKNCNYGLSAKGIPYRNNTISQIDRLVNSFSSLTNDCFYVCSFKGVSKGFERKNRNLNMFSSEIKKEYESDFTDAKKYGQSKIGIFSYSETEDGMHTILAAMLSIWSGSHSFDVDKIAKAKIHNNIIKLNPSYSQRLNNKSVSSFIHLPEKPYLTQNTKEPIFEIPSITKKANSFEISIGNIMQNNRVLDEYKIPVDSLLFNTEIVGMIGRGKSYLVASMINQLLQIDLGCLIFDLKGEYAELFVENENVMTYTIGEPAPLGINLFNINSNIEAQNVLSLINEMLTIAGAPFSPTMLNIFEGALQKIVKKKKKDLEVFMQCLNESSKDYIKRMKTSYSRDSIDAILNRLNYILGGVNFEVFSALENTINFHHLDSGKKIILDFSEFLRRGASTASLFLVCNLVLHLLSKHASQKGITNKLRYLVILEEAMYLIPKRYNLESAASLGYSEQNFIMGRSLGIGTITIYQLWDSVSSVVHANSLTKILFRGEDVEKIRTSISLTEEQYDYLSHLPDRHFILKSKSLSGPSLLKTKTFDKKRFTKDEFSQIAKKKFLRNGIPFRRISRNLIELRNEEFNSNNTKSAINKRRTPLAIGSNNSSVEDHRILRQNSWEWCINICPARLHFKDKSSNWIKKNFCDIQHPKISSIIKKLFSNDLSSLIEIINKNPKYFVHKILDYYQNISSNEPVVLSFCTLNFILLKLKEKYNFSNTWKNNTLIKLRMILNENYLSSFSMN